MLQQKMKYCCHIHKEEELVSAVYPKKCQNILKRNKEIGIIGKGFLYSCKICNPNLSVGIYMFKK